MPRCIRQSFDAYRCLVFKGRAWRTLGLDQRLGELRVLTLQPRGEIGRQTLNERRDLLWSREGGCNALGGLAVGGFAVHSSTLLEV